MKSLEDLEKALEIGLKEWESTIVEKHTKKMGLKVVREVTQKTPVKTGNLKRRWFSRVDKEKGQIVIFVYNDAEYAPHVNYGHRIVKAGKTIGKREGKFMLEDGIETYKQNYMKDDVEEMLSDLRKAMK